MGFVTSSFVTSSFWTKLFLSYYNFYDEAQSLFDINY